MADDLKERALAGVVERAARSEHAKSLVLRGGLVLRHYIAPTPRPADDVDFLGLADAAATRAVLAPICASTIGDGLRYSPPDIHVIWEETEFPGLRARTVASIESDSIAIQIDVGFGDPRVAPDRRLAIARTHTPIASVAPETLFAWKLHGLFERGDGKWRAKDLHDLLLLGRCEDLDEAILPACVRVAFHSRGDALAIADRFLSGSWGESRSSARKWQSYRRRRGDANVPEVLGPVIDEVRARVRPLIERANRT